MRNIFKSWTEQFRESNDEWLLVDQQGEYQYRNPDSLYVHRWELFSSREAALAHIEENVARADRRHLRLYHREDDWG